MDLGLTSLAERMQVVFCIFIRKHAFTPVVLMKASDGKTQPPTLLHAGQYLFCSS